MKMLRISLLYKNLTCFMVLGIIGSHVDVSAVAHGHVKQEVKAIKVGLVSSLSETWGRMGHHFINMAISDFYQIHPNYKTRLQLKARDSNKDVITSAGFVDDLIKSEQVIAIIGPETSQEAQFDINLGERSEVPLITYSASSPTLSSPYFIQATQDDSSQAQAISAIIQAFGWREVIPVYVNNEFGGGFIPFLVDALQQIHTLVPYRCVISSSATDEQIKEELYILRGMQTGVFVVHMNEDLASRVFSAARNLSMMSAEYVWIITSSIANTLGSLDHEMIQSMQGVLGVKTYVSKSKAMIESFKSRWRRTYDEADKLDLWNMQLSLYGLWAYDATFLLAEAVEQLQNSSFTFDHLNSSSSPAIDLLAFGVSSVGPQLIHRLHNTSFRGMSGNFTLVNGKLLTSTFEIINVIGTRENNVGFWTMEKGIVRKLDVGINRRNSSYSTSKDNLGPITWPGDSSVVPKGWMTNRNQLRILVPVKNGFTAFVKASENHGSMQISGFCIDVFEAVVQTLPYPLRYEYVPFEGSYYDDMIWEVYLKNADGIVGDVTILSNRSSYIDFTTPYLEADVLMVVPAIKDSTTSRVWAFLRPLSWKLWILTLCFFILIAFVVWVNEYGINDEFRAESTRSQIGLCLYFSFSTMVFSHKQAPKSNLSRLVMVCWLFTLLLLTQSYTASLASILTVEKLHYTDVNELVRAGKRVGCQGANFIRGLLRNMQFDDSNIITYETEEELYNLLSKGSDKGGIDAAFDEAPYIQLFLSHYCLHSSHYMSTVVPSLSRTDGLAFVFPKGSPLVTDVSRGLLKLREGENITTIWNKWMSQAKDCSIDGSSTTAQSSSSSPSSALDLDSFVALFAITGGASVAAVVLKLSMFLNENRPVWKKNGGHRTIIERLQELNRAFHLKKCFIKDSVIATELDIYDAELTLSTTPLSPPPDHWRESWHLLAS